MPLPPAPAMTRPTIRALMVGAAPQRAEPASKSTTVATRTHFMLKVL